MSDELVQQITKDTPLTWITGTVRTIRADGKLVVTYKGGEIPGVGVSDQYTPVVGDIVQCLSMANKGMLALCSTNTVPPATGGDLPDATVDTGGPWHTDGFDLTVNHWDHLSNAAPDHLAVWLYSSGAFSGFQLIEMSKFEIQLNVTTSEPLEFSLLSSADTSTAPVKEPGALYLQPAPSPGILSWVPLPIGWASALLAGTATGISIGGGQYTTAIIDGSGLLRFTSI